MPGTPAGGRTVSRVLVKVGDLEGRHPRQKRIKVRTMMRSRRNQGKRFLARNHKRNLYSRRLSPLHAERYGPHHARLWEENG